MFVVMLVTSPAQALEKVGFKVDFYHSSLDFIILGVTIDICKITKSPFEDKTCCWVTGKRFDFPPEVCVGNAM